MMAKPEKTNKQKKLIIELFTACKEIQIKHRLFLVIAMYCTMAEITSKKGSF